MHFISFFLQGILRVNPRNYREAYLPSPNPRQPDILIPDVLRRNRALNGDEVYVDLLQEEEWVVQVDRLEVGVGLIERERLQRTALLSGLPCEAPPGPQSRGDRIRGRATA